MVVDDDPVSLKLMKLFLETAGYGVLAVSSGEEALNQVEAYKPDVVLLDYQIPGAMSGVSVCRALKTDEKARDIPVIFVTAHTQDNVLKEAFDAGAVDYVRKPVNRVELFARIKSALSQRELLQKTALEERIKAVFETAGAICHEMNQPLQLIGGYSELLALEVPPDSRAAEMADEIFKSTVKLGEITRKLMNITRYETREYLEGRRILDIYKSTDG